jgi:hypothetical protein
MRPTEPRHLHARMSGLASSSSGHQQKRQLTASPSYLKNTLIRPLKCYLLKVVDRFDGVGFFELLLEQLLGG